MRFTLYGKQRIGGRAVDTISISRSQKTLKVYSTARMFTKLKSVRGGARTLQSFLPQHPLTIIISVDAYNTLSRYALLTAYLFLKMIKKINNRSERRKKKHFVRRTACLISCQIVSSIKWFIDTSIIGCAFFFFSQTLLHFYYEKRNKRDAQRS